jgi:hypothetical protein
MGAMKKTVKNDSNYLLSPLYEKKSQFTMKRLIVCVADPGPIQHDHVIKKSMLFGFEIKC